MGERRRVGVELTLRPPPGERLSLGPAGILIADNWLSKRTGVDWWEGGLTLPGVRDLWGWRLVRSAARNDSGHSSANSSSIFCCWSSRLRRISSAIARMWGGGGGSGGMIKGEDKQQSNNGCVGKWQREQKYEEQKWMVVGECGRFRRLATQLQRPESHGNKDLGMNGMDCVVLFDRE